MKPFVSVAEPHDDILGEELTLDTFAANLWSVHMGEAPEEYQNPDVFWEKTYTTRGLKNIMETVKRRLEGGPGDPVIQLQTPFGGGKTHTLISLYHMASEMDARVVVIAGDALDAAETTLWAELERQLRGENREFTNETSPGTEKLKRLLQETSPVLILMDEVLVYGQKAAGVIVGDSTLSEQIGPFIQELTEVVSSLREVSLVVTIPSSHLEHYGEAAERLYQQIAKVLGRTHKIIAPVENDEIYDVINRRLFKRIHEDEKKSIVHEIVDFAYDNGLLPESMEKSEYRELFLKSYPFQPEVIDVLYERWGSFPKFQRTRGVLRLLALVVRSLCDSTRPFIRLADFDLSLGDIKREFIEFTGNEFDSIIASDITSPDSGAVATDDKLQSYRPYRLGTSIATTIFLYSFAGGSERVGAGIREIKLSCIDPNLQVSIVTEALEMMRKRLFYLHERDGLYYFSSKPNLERLIVTRKENVSEDDIREMEEDFIKKIVGKKKLEVHIWPGKSSDIPDTMKLKLVVLRDDSEVDEFISNKGKHPRVYRNSLIFLLPAPDERPAFNEFVRTQAALKSIYNDRTLQMDENERKGIKHRIRENEKDSNTRTRNLYRHVIIPAKEGTERLDLGRPAYGVDTPVEYEIESLLKQEDKLVDKLNHDVLAARYLKGDYAETARILESFYSVPGEIRITGEDVLKKAIKLGVKRGSFGLGVLVDDKPECTFIEEDCSPSLSDGEIIIKPHLCVKEPMEEEKPAGEEAPPAPMKSAEIVEKPEEPEKMEFKQEPDKTEAIRSISLEFRIPDQEMIQITNIRRVLMKYFNDVQVELDVTIRSADGEMPESEYRNIKDFFNEQGIRVREDRRA